MDSETKGHLAGIERLLGELLQVQQLQLQLFQDQADKQCLRDSSPRSTEAREGVQPSWAPRGNRHNAPSLYHEKENGFQSLSALPHRKSLLSALSVSTITETPAAQMMTSVVPPDMAQMMTSVVPPDIPERPSASVTPQGKSSNERKTSKEQTADGSQRITSKPKKLQRVYTQSSVASRSWLQRKQTQGSMAAPHTRLEDLARVNQEVQSIGSGNNGSSTNVHDGTALEMPNEDSHDRQISVGTSASMGSVEWWLSASKTISRKKRASYRRTSVFLMTEGDGWPSEVPQALIFMLLATGSVDPEHVRLARLYHLYRLGIAASMVVFGAHSSLRLLSKLVSERFANQQIGIDIDILYIFVLVFVCAPLWRFGQQQLLANGPMLSMVRQMTLQGYPWHSMIRGLVVSMIIAIPFGLIIIGFGALPMLRGEALWQVILARPQDGADVLLGHSLQVLGFAAAFVAGPLIVVVSCGCIWLVWLSTRLHEYDLLCYAAALHRSLLEEDDGAPDPVPLLEEVEEAITVRLRLASESWVGSICRVAGFAAVVCLLHICYFFTVDPAALSSEAMLQLILWTATSFALPFILVMPMANVAETFQWDVIKALNTPLMVQRAQKYFGQQFLEHITTLDWGFRRWGRVISPKHVYETMAAICATVGAAVAQSVIRYITQAKP